MQITEDQLTKLRTENPRGVKVFTVKPAEGEGPADHYVFRTVDRATYTQYRAHQKRGLVGQGPADPASILAKNLLLFPTPQEFDTLRERAPAITEELGELLAAEADAGLVVTEGKL